MADENLDDSSFADENLEDNSSADENLEGSSFGNELWRLFLTEPHIYIVGVRSSTAAPIGLQDAGNDEIFQAYRNGGFGAVPASAAAVSCLEKQTFLAGEKDGGGEAEAGGGITECIICFEEFLDGVQVSVMPCPSRGHRFHPDCIAKWLGMSNKCPLCRHELPTALT